MFDQIKNLVKEHLGNNPEVANAIPAGQEDAVHTEVANQIQNGLATHATSQGGIGGLLNSLQGSLTSNNPLTNAIEGGIASTLGSKLGLPPMVTGAISAALPGLLQKFAHKANDPNDNSITHEGLSKILTGGGLGSLFGK